MLPKLLESLALSDPLTYLVVFLGVSLLMVWRLEAMLDHGLEGTALGTLMLPYCSGLGNLLFVYLMVSREGPVKEVLTNCLVNNVTNLTLLIGLPALFWGLMVLPEKASAKAAGARGKKPAKPAKPAKSAKGGGPSLEGQINRLSLLLTLAAIVFFTGTVWVLGGDGKLDRNDGIVLIGLFLFWQCFQVYDVMKHNLKSRLSFGFMFYVDALLVLACAYLMYESLSWLVDWLSAQKTGFISAANLGWLTAWLMVLPNAVPAFYYGWKRRADVVYSSQVGDGHICIPLALGLCALFKVVPMSGFSSTALLLVIGAAVLHAAFLLINGGLPRWAGGVLVGAYGWFVYSGLLS